MILDAISVVFKHKTAEKDENPGKNGDYARPFFAYLLECAFCSKTIEPRAISRYIYTIKAIKGF